MVRRFGLLACLLLASSLVARGDGDVVVETVESEPEISDTDRDHWAFSLPRRSEPPEVQDQQWCRTPVDQFILAELERHKLQPVSAADRETLLRRVTFDLTGLPPTLEEQEEFLADGASDAYERLVDRLLASPAYGERWAMFWLDLARFAETDGFEHDKVRPQAWRYRDWVLDALNEDLPYDRFLQLQLAADAIEPGNGRVQLATGFLLAGPDMPDINLQAERRHVFLNDMTANVGEVLLGLQFGCAQCHDHKTDPISQRDFYRLRACLEEIDLFAEPRVELASLDESRSLSVTARATISRSRLDEPSRLWVRGDFRRPGPELSPGVLRVAVPSGSESLLPDPRSDRRLQLAEWMTDQSNPLTARVIVNRLWQHHFGIGLVPTASDFGFMGIGPSHPELLDWLATELMRQDWSLKAMHRLLVTSAVYRTASQPTNFRDVAGRVDPRWTQLVSEDPDNKLLGRRSRRRLEGEAIRDTLLAAAGRLNREFYGPGVRPTLPSEVVTTLLRDQWPVTRDFSQHDRRSLYLFVRRNLKYPLFDVFDRPDPNLSCARRMQTTIAPQALAMLNSEFVHTCAARLAVRLDATTAANRDDRITTLYRLLLSRAPASAELDAVRAWLAAEPSSGWVDLCLALLNTNEFVYVD